MLTRHRPTTVASTMRPCPNCRLLTAWHSPCHCAPRFVEDGADTPGLPGVALTLLCVLAALGVVTLAGWAWRALALWGG